LVRTRSSRARTHTHKQAHKLKFKLHGHCSNNQSKQIAILKDLEKLGKLQDGKDNDKSVAIYTDGKITLDLLQNKFKRNRLIKLIRNKRIALAHSKWNVHFGWVKGQAGIEGKELVDRMAKEAAVEEGPVKYDKITRDVKVKRKKDKGINMWEQQWMDTGKGAVTKSFSPHKKHTHTKHTPHTHHTHTTHTH